MGSTEPEKGDKVAWNWGGGAPGGTVVEKKKEGAVSITSHRGNEIKKKGSPDDPAVHISRSGNDVVKKASELTVEKKGGGSGGKRKGDAGEKRKDPHEKNEEGKEVKKGGKEENKKQKKSQEEDAKGKTDGKKEVNGTADSKKAKGRPKGSNSGSQKKKAPAARKEGDMVSTRTRSQAKK